jgi:hypothetical protein
VNITQQKKCNNHTATTLILFFTPFCVYKPKMTHGDDKTIKNFKIPHTPSKRLREFEALPN